MNVLWNKVILHNFGSYNHAEVNLKDKGFCSVIGENKYKKDNALSNGSGKSFLWSALCYTITGETIQGLKKNLKNLNITDDNTGYTTVDITVDNDHYVITRAFAPKSNLTIVKNDVDLSGKTFTESEKILGEQLPALTKDLIATTAILGQGLPTKFSSLKPSGRKDLLEKLTNSDFMIEDVKNRIAARQDVILSQIRTVDDALLVANTQLSTAQTQLNTVLTQIEQHVRPDYDKLISDTNTEIATCKTKLDDVNNKIKTNDFYLEQANNDLLTFTNNRSNEIIAVTNKFNEDLNSKAAEKQKILLDMNSITGECTALQNEIKRLKAITDICPTCGQKIPGKEKPSTVLQEEQLQKKYNEKITLTESLNKVQVDTTALQEKLDIEKQIVNNKYNDAINSIKSQQATLKNYGFELQIEQLTLNTKLQNLNTGLAKLTYEKEHEEQTFNNLKNTKGALETEVKRLNKIIISNTDQRNALSDHLDIIRKMDALAKRDFRGYLLVNIIAYLNKKAKEYSQVVFGTDELEIYLDGNDLNISYCNKLLDNLSGGERQRVDLIVQFALRDLLSTQSNYSSNILVLDEIFDNLDKVATENILNLITTKLCDIESVFIISHHADELELSYDSELKVIKNSDGISEVFAI